MVLLTNLFSPELQAAVKIAKRSPQKTFKTGCVIVKRGKVISTGWSHVGRSMKNYYSVHAEIMSLLRAPRDELHGATVYIATLSGKSGNLSTSSAPCRSCASALFAAGVSRAVYTTSKGEKEIVFDDDTIERLRFYHPSGNEYDEKVA